MPGLIQSYVDSRVKLHPTARAVVMADEELTYAQLDRWSNSLARALQSHGCSRGDRVALLVSKSPLAIASILGILKADCIYVPLDVESPIPRATEILHNCEPRLLLADALGTKTLQGLRSHSSKPLGVQAASVEQSSGHSGRNGYLFSGDDIARFSDEPVCYRNGPHDLAYILYTSGSTGAPKGVPITHASVAHFVDWASAYFEATGDDRVSGHPPLHFDLSVFDIFGAFATGAELHLVPAFLNLSARAMAAFIRSSELTQWFSVPSALSYMAKFDAVRHRDFPKLKRVLWCGEVLPAAILRYWMERLPHVQFTNLYGPTETTIASSYYTVPEVPYTNEAIPIGRPCEGESLLVLDERLQPVAQDVIGDLYIGGVGLSPGYWKDEQKTCTAFLQNPVDSSRIYKTGDRAKVGRNGLIYFGGRADNQIKSRGYRVELGEIEAALSRIEDLEESAVVAIPSSGFEGSLICCAFAPLEGARVTIVSLREALRAALPHYMLPGRWLSLDRLPKNTNGKIDRKLLKEFFLSSDGATRLKNSAIQSIEV